MRINFAKKAVTTVNALSFITDYALKPLWTFAFKFIFNTKNDVRYRYYIVVDEGGEHRHLQKFSKNYFKSSKKTC